MSQAIFELPFWRAFLANPLKVASRPEDVAESALFFGSPASRHVTGETLLIDAGRHLGTMP